MAYGVKLQKRYSEYIHSALMEMQFKTGQCGHTDAEEAGKPELGVLIHGHVGADENVFEVVEGIVDELHRGLG